MNEVTKSKSLNRLLTAIENIDLPNASSNVLEDYMAATQVLDKFTKTVKDEIKTRMENGAEFDSYQLASRKTLTVEDEYETINALNELGFDTEEVTEWRLLKPKSLIDLVGVRNKEKLKLKESVSTFIKKKHNA